ncbi:MAG TPA: hypothetical protein VNQ32_13995 [Steroidobacteraceae bacterium]|nr:hypothetical protein [Steroidobacteraceae bacterium]
MRPHTGLLLSSAVVALLLASGCSTVVGGACHKVQPHQTAGNLPPLKMPAGLDGPDTAEALAIPEINQPELPLDPDGPCLDAPPAITAPPLPATPEYDLTDIERLSRTPQQAGEEGQEEESRRRRRPPSRPR